MCAYFDSVLSPELYSEAYGVAMPEGAAKGVWPAYTGTLIRRPREADAGDEAVPEREALTGMFGLVPHWAKDTKIARHTYNARSETAHEKPSFRDAWKRGQHCLVPALAIYEQDWRSGKAVQTRIARADGKPMAIAGLWAWCRLPDGKELHSFTMLTVNAAKHPVMSLFHKPEDEKRMPVILPDEAYQAWLEAPAKESMDFMRPYRDDGLVVGNAPG